MNDVASKAKVTVTMDGSNRSAELPLITGTIGPAVADIRKLYADLGIVTVTLALLATSFIRRSCPELGRPSGDHAA